MDFNARCRGHLVQNQFWLDRHGNDVTGSWGCVNRWRECSAASVPAARSAGAPHYLAAKNSSSALGSIRGTVIQLKHEVAIAAICAPGRDLEGGGMLGRLAAPRSGAFLAPERFAEHRRVFSTYHQPSVNTG